MFVEKLVIENERTTFVVQLNESIKNPMEINEREGVNSTNISH